jgi:hypothetical protein
VRISFIVVPSIVPAVVSVFALFETLIPKSLLFSVTLKRRKGEHW